MQSNQPLSPNQPLSLPPPLQPEAAADTLAVRSFSRQIATLSTSMAERNALQREAAKKVLTLCLQQSEIQQETTRATIENTDATYKRIGEYLQANENSQQAHLQSFNKRIAELAQEKQQLLQQQANLQAQIRRF